MNKTLLVIALSLLAGFAAGAWFSSTEDAGESARSGAPAYFDSDATTEERLAVLERIVAEERDARLVLEEQLQGLYADLDRIDVTGLQSLLAAGADDPQNEGRIRVASNDRQESRRAMRNFTDMRTRRLVGGGFSEARAATIVQLEDEIRMAALQDEYEARQNGEAVNAWRQMESYQERMRASLGDEEYGKYLEAYGGSSAVVVNNVIGSSPANRAGLQAGDQILSYNGDRVYNMNQLRDLAFDGSPGEDVIVEIERDGQRMQIVLPRGPMGISGSGGRRMGYPFGG